MTSSSFYDQLLAGSVAGMASVVVCHPLDTIRTRLQSSPEKFHGFRDCIRQTYKREAWRGFYKGFFPPLCSQAIYKTIIFTTSSNTKTYLCEKSKVFSENPLLTIWCSGAVAGGINSIVVTPVELIRNRLQCQYEAHKQSRIYRNSFQVVSSVIKRHGILGLWRGMSATLYRDSLGVACYFVGFESLKEYLSKVSYLSRDVQLLSAGAFGGICFWAVALPFDTVKTLVQVQPGNTPYHSFASATASVYREHGMSHFYRGWQAAFSRGIPGAAITFWAYGKTMALVQK